MEYKIKKSNKKWPRHSTACKMTHKVPVFFASQSLNSIKHDLQKNVTHYETINYIYVIDKNNKLRGVFSIKELFRNKPETKASHLMRTDIVSVHPNTPIDKAAYLVIRNNIKAIPVIDDEKKLIGVLPSDSINETLLKARDKTLLQMAGILKEDFEYEDILKVSILKAYRNRIPWMIIGLVGGFILANIIGLFENTLKENIIIAGFIPVITYMSNAIAIQVQMVFIRDLAIHHRLPLKKYFLKQFLVSLLIGVTCSILLILLSITGWVELKTMIVISFAMLIAVLIAVITSLAIPYTFKKFKHDPGLASGPFSTIIQDMTSIIIYFLITSLFL